MACGCSTTPPPSPMAKIEPRLWAPPPALPPVQRRPDGEMTGADSLRSFTSLYEVAGQIREAFIALQEQASIALRGKGQEN
jgi:hypothetical protein